MLKTGVMKQSGSAYGAKWLDSNTIRAAVAEGVSQWCCKDIRHNAGKGQQAICSKAGTMPKLRQGLCAFASPLDKL